MSNDQPSSLVVITGASKGIGRAIAISMTDSCKESKALPLPIHLVLIARSAEKLTETVEFVREACGEMAGVITTCHNVDLSNLDTLSSDLNDIFDPLKQTKYQNCWLFNNAGSVEPLGATSTLADGSISELRTAIDLNVTSAMWLSSKFTKTFASDTTSIRVINISSLCAIEPFATMAVYCAGKAARDMFHMVLAKEAGGKEGESVDTKSVLFKVLNWAPGACDTVMTDVLADCPHLDAGLHDYFASSKKESKLIDPLDSARKLVDILVKDDYGSGSHIDYWDA